MSKFSDPNYYLLKQYFDVLLVNRVGTEKSYLIGPNKTVVSQGGLYTILYENNPSYGYVGHRFKIQEINGNRFKMEYVGLESTFEISTLDSTTTSAQLSAFGIGNEMYFRKDSFFHYWLARPEQDDLYHDYANQQKTFLFFGKIWPGSGTNIYNIEFEGLKDFTLRGLPQTNQTINMKEWLKIYWDQVHHEMYNMTKTFWSMFDSKEIDIRWLGYIASIYGIDISEGILKDLSLREWVDSLPYFLKRIGTYNALYIVWKVFLSNTKNVLNVYERWGEWCVQTLSESIDDIRDSFIDYHFLEFYGTQPSGGAGDQYYSHYNPDNYPTHALQAPNTCGTYRWSVDSSENFLTTTYSKLNCSIGDIKENSIEVTGYDPQSYITQVMYLSGGSYSGNFTHSIGIEMSSSTSSPSNIVFWALSNEYAKISDMSEDYLCLSYEISGGSRYFKLIENQSSTVNSVKTSHAYSADVPYYLIIKRDGLVLSISIYNKNRKRVEDLVETISLNLNSIETYSNLYVLNNKRIATHTEWYGTIYALYIDNVNYTLSVASSGYPVMTPHYKVQIDLSTEPLGDIFDDSTIISEDVITELYTNFEYVRPVNKFAYYEELISPKGKIDRTGGGVPLYPTTSNGYLDTYFTGSRFLSGGNGLDYSELDTYSHFQSFASKTWTISHGLNSIYLLVQPWIFSGLTSANAKMVMPIEIHIVDSNTVELIFNESVRGLAAVAGPVSASGITYTGTNYVTAGNTTWSYDHNLDTNTPSGYTSPPGPVVMHWDTNGYRIIPDSNLIYTEDNLRSVWNTPVSGGSLIRRSDYIHNQYDSSTSWTVEHNLNSWVIIQCYDITTDKEIFPKEVKLINRNKLEVYWENDKRGYVHVVSILRDNIAYSSYSCDEFGLGICANTLGYWKIGTGTDSQWNPFTEGDLETPVTSGAYKSIESDLNNIYIDFIVPEDFEGTNITEVGLFNYLDQMVLYSRASGLYKLDEVQTYFHYRIGKLNSSSSSSSKSSSSSSSS